MEWTNDKKAIEAFYDLMIQGEPLMNEFMKSVQPYFDDSPNTLLLLILGKTFYFYKQGIDEGHDIKNSVDYMIQKIATCRELEMMMRIGVGMGFGGHQ